MYAKNNSLSKNLTHFWEMKLTMELMGPYDRTLDEIEQMTIFWTWRKRRTGDGSMTKQPDQMTTGTVLNVT